MVKFGIIGKSNKNGTKNIKNLCPKIYLLENKAVWNCTCA